jgi:hypothetical protein
MPEAKDDALFQVNRLMAELSRVKLNLHEVNVNNEKLDADNHIL